MDFATLPLGQGSLEPPKPVKKQAALSCHNLIGLLGAHLGLLATLVGFVLFAAGTLLGGSRP